MLSGDSMRHFINIGERAGRERQRHSKDGKNRVRKDRQILERNRRKHERDVETFHAEI